MLWDYEEIKKFQLIPKSFLNFAVTNFADGDIVATVVAHSL